jgi:hypothetical protein
MGRVLSASILAAQQPVSGPIIQTFAGADFTFQSENRPAISAPFGNPQDVNVDAAGNIYFVDVFFQAFRVNPDGTVRVLAGNGFRAIPRTGWMHATPPLGRTAAWAWGRMAVSTSAPPIL